MDALNTPKMENFTCIPKVDVLNTPKVEDPTCIYYVQKVDLIHSKVDVLNTPRVECLRPENQMFTLSVSRHFIYLYDQYNLHATNIEHLVFGTQPSDTGLESPVVGYGVVGSI